MHFSEIAEAVQQSSTYEKLAPRKIAWSALAFLPVAVRGLNVPVLNADSISDFHYSLRMSSLDAKALLSNHGATSSFRRRRRSCQLRIASS